MRAATEEDFVDADGRREHTGKANPMAKKWADNMTRHYDELAGKEPIFGQLRNCIDLAVVAALIAKEALLVKADCSLPLLYGAPGAGQREVSGPPAGQHPGQLAAKRGQLADQRLGRSKAQSLAAGRPVQIDRRARPQAGRCKAGRRLWWWN